MSAEILLIEDSPTQSLRLKLLLEREGIVVRVAESGQAGIAAALRQPPGAVVLDVNLPDMDGFQVCQVLKGHPITAGTPVLMLTVKDRAGDTLAGLKAGADAYIPKDEYAEVNLIQALRDLDVIALANVQASGG